MVADALDGKIELIVTKSVSRFARNTVDSLTTIRKLKDKGVEVFFEKENIWTFDSKGELLLTIMSSLAQEESRSISENVTWSLRKRFADGRVSLGYSSFLGYDKGPDGNLVINLEEAKTVVLIYRLFLAGKSPGGIAKHLTAAGIPTPQGKTQWTGSTVNSILTNEKYKGDALLQKSFTVDFLSKKMKQNTGEVPQYYVEGNHEAIITPEEFDLVQAEIARRKQFGRSTSTTSIFSSKIVCGECGSFYGHKVWHSNDERYRRHIWQCNAMFKGTKRCPTPAFDDNELKEMFMEAYEQLSSRRAQIIADMRVLLDTLTDCSAVDKQMEHLDEELEEINTLVRVEIQNNATQPDMQDAFDEKFAKLRDRYEATEAKIAELKGQRDQREDRRIRIAAFLRDFEQKPAVDRWDDQLWVTTIDNATVHGDGSVDFKFFSGQTIRIQSGKKKNRKVVK